MRMKNQKIPSYVIIKYFSRSNYNFENTLGKNDMIRIRIFSIIKSVSITELLFYHV